MGLIGLGIMGGAMAEALVAAGHPVSGFDVAAAAMERLKAAGGQGCDGAAQVARDAEVLIFSLSTSPAMLESARNVAASVQAGGRCRLVIETSTLPLDDKNEVARILEGAGIAVLDCPISGTAVRMKEGAWTIYCSGAEPSYERARPLLQVFTQMVPFVGAYGNGTKMKFAANHLVAILNVACAESTNLARKMGLDPRQVLELFGNSPVIGTGVMRLRMPFMIERRYEPATMKVEVWQKDMQVIGDMARSVDCPTPLFSACVPIYSAAMAQGRAKHDTASVSEVLAGLAGVDRS
ncbi:MULTISPECIES: NAD(P)-binding domain-containing protein [Ramlibacter]|uniref:NAD(P)-binding domain-containing protein n=1 Tax=Ramlibacter TaxID=174951 RepID=UPI0015EE8D50|nr:NAD(P)-dependent oxidoreductase [Ramlibacter sp. CGMCC 1.13660]